MIRRCFAWLCMAGASAMFMAMPASAQDYPRRPIRLISPSAPGGATDVTARIVAERLTQTLNVPVVVENKPGATGALALDLVSKAPPDGYTLVVTFVAASVFHPLLNDKLPFNAQKDFTPISQLTLGGNVLVVNAALPVRTVAEFVAYVKSQPKPPSYGSWGNGSGGHLAGEFLKSLTGIDMVHVPYRSASALGTDMAGGHMMLGVLDTTNALTHTRTGKVRALAVTGPVRSRSMPDVPTLVEQGIAYSAGIWTGILGPANMPKPIVDKLNAEIARILREPEVRERFLTLAGDYPVTGTPAEFDKIIRDDFVLWKRIITDARITM